MLFCFREPVFFLAEGDALHQEGHISCQNAHRLQSLRNLHLLSLLSPIIPKK